MSVPEDLKELLEAGSHFGHQARRWNPRMAPFIYTERDGIHVFDLTITARMLNEACEFIKETAKEGKEVVFVGTKRQAKAIIKEEALKAKAPYVSERWMGGTVTNWEEIRKRIRKLVDTRRKWESGFFDKYTKKERVLINRDMERLNRFFGGLTELSDLPDVMFVVDTNKEKVAIREAIARGITVVGITDSNCDPDVVDYPIPANDDAVRSIKYIVTRVAEAYAEGKAARPKNTAPANPALQGQGKKDSNKKTK